MHGRLGELLDDFSQIICEFFCHLPSLIGACLVRFGVRILLCHTKLTGSYSSSFSLKLK